MDRKGLRYVARSVALLWAVAWTLFGLVAGIGEGYGPAGVFLHMAMPGLVFLFAVIVAWRWEMVGGILLVLESLLTLQWFWFAWWPEGFVTLMLPPLVAGGLFLLDWYLSRPTTMTGHGA